MGLLDFLWKLLGRSRSAQEPPRAPRRPWRRARLAPLRRQPRRQDRHAVETAGPTPPYRFARFGSVTGRYLDLSGDADPERLVRFGLPDFRTPEQLAQWLDLPLGTVAWLVHRFSDNRPENEQRAHYHFRWIRKRSGGWRLLEAPKTTLRGVQRLILREILDKVPPHPQAHGFVAGRSIVTNARPHTGRRIVVKFDLDNFYASVNFARVTAIFRSLGYSREAAIWLARLTTSALPSNIRFPDGQASAIRPFLPRHLPQGAPTSPALANLSAYSLDVRLAGLARAFGAGYTRYADDLTFSGDVDLLKKLPVFIPFVTRIVRSERFRLNPRKRRIIRDNQRQTVAGVVVNAKVNVSRREFDRLKAVLTNCVRHGPESQNRDGLPAFAEHLRGRVAHVQQLNPRRGEKLLALYRRIRWPDPLT